MAIPFGGSPAVRGILGPARDLQAVAGRRMVRDHRQGAAARDREPLQSVCETYFVAGGNSVVASGEFLSVAGNFACRANAGGEGGCFARAIGEHGDDCGGLRGGGTNPWGDFRRRVISLDHADFVCAGARGGRLELWVAALQHMDVCGGVLCDELEAAERIDI